MNENNRCRDLTRSGTERTKTMTIFEDSLYDELISADGTPARDVPRRVNENLVECTCGKLYMYAILEGAWGIILLPEEAGVRCPFCGSTDYVSIRAHSGDFFNATLRK